MEIKLEVSEFQAEIIFGMFYGAALTIQDEEMARSMLEISHQLVDIFHQNGLTTAELREIVVLSYQRR